MTQSTSPGASCARCEEQEGFALGKCCGRFMDARTEGNTPWPLYTKAMMPNTSGSVAQLPVAVAAPGTYPPARPYTPVLHVRVGLGLGKRLPQS